MLGIRSNFCYLQEKIQLETARLYKLAGINPLAGCLPILATIPVWIGLYRALSNVADERYGAEVVCADRGKKATELLTPPHQFDACFMDIQMPEMDGFLAAKIIRDMEHKFNNQIRCGEVPGF